MLNARALSLVVAPFLYLLSLVKKTKMLKAILLLLKTVNLVTINLSKSINFTSLKTLLFGTLKKISI